MKTNGKYLGLDFGDRRVGVALSDPKGTIAFPREFIAYLQKKNLLDQIVTLCMQEQVKAIIVGNPLHLGGQKGQRVEVTQQFVQELKQALPQMQVDLFDERFTTQWAVGKLNELGMSKKEQKGERDSVAAQMILQTYLDWINSKS